MFCPEILLIAVAFIMLIIFLGKNKKEGWYFNEFRGCLVNPTGYPSEWEKIYGPCGFAYPYAKPNKVLEDTPSECGGCWSSFTQY